MVQGSRRHQRNSRSKCRALPALAATAPSTPHWIGALPCKQLETNSRQDIRNCSSVRDMVRSYLALAGVARRDQRALGTSPDRAAVRIANSSVWGPIPARRLGPRASLRTISMRDRTRVALLGSGTQIGISTSEALWCSRGAGLLRGGQRAGPHCRRRQSSRRTPA